jgi:hypothetical protein
MREDGFSLIHRYNDIQCSMLGGLGSQKGNNNAKGAKEQVQCPIQVCFSKHMASQQPW